MVTRGWVMVTRVKQSKWSSHRTSVNQWKFLSGSTHMHIVDIDWKIRYAFLFSGIQKNIQWSLRWHIHTTRDVLPFFIRAAVDHWCWSWALNLKWQVPRPAPCGAAQISRFRLGGLGMLPMGFLQRINGFKPNRSLWRSHMDINYETWYIYIYLYIYT